MKSPHKFKCSNLWKKIQVTLTLSCYVFGLFFSPAENKTAAALFSIHRKAPHLRAWKMLSFAYYSPMMQKGMNFTSYVGDFKAMMNYLNSDVNRYFNAVCSEAQIERYGFLFLSSALPNTAGDLDSDLREWHTFYNEFHRILQFKRPQQLVICKCFCYLKICYSRRCFFNKS